MAEWRVRGYVQDSDEEDESQTASKEVVNNNHTISTELDRTHNVEINDIKDKHRGAQTGIGQNGTVSGHPREDCNSTATQREKEVVPSSAVGHHGQDARDTTRDVYEEIDELQQDHYGTESAARREEELLNRAEDMGVGLRSCPVQSSKISLPSSTLSSPLSEVLSIEHRVPAILSTDRSAPREHKDEWGSSLDSGPEALESTPQRNTTNEPAPPAVNQAQISQRAFRSLRRRNPIQLHPYAVESEQYRQTLKARGVKPLRIAQMEAEAARIREQVSQNRDIDGEDSQFIGSDTEQPALDSSSPVSSQGGPIAPSQDKRDVFVFGDDDLPDMTTILSHSKLKYVGNGHKRRKTAKAKSPILRIPQGLDLDWHDHGPSSVLIDDDVLFDVPPSPPHSDGQTALEPNHIALPTFRIPRMPSPTTLPTPVTSSEPRRRHLLEIFEDELSDDQSDLNSSMADDEVIDPEIYSSEEEASHQLQRAQRKIRGVLPASWLKLDLNTKKKKPGDIHKAFASASPERNISQRGVARPVFVPRSKNHDPPNLRYEIETLSDVGSGESEIDKLPQRAWTHQRLEDHDEEAPFVERWGEAAEDNQIDAMLSSGTKAFRPRKSSKRQTKIGDFDSYPRLKAHRISKKSSGHGAHQRDFGDQLNEGHRRNPKFRPPRLGILDAPLTKESPQDSVPQFLKVASRTARSRQDKGRHSPSRKIVRLATRDDDRDANETLRNWREGTIAPIANLQPNKVSSRQPLYPRSANSHVSSRADEVEGSLANSSASRMTTAKSHIRSMKPRKLQSSLDHLIGCRHSVGPDPTERKAASWLQQATRNPKKQRQIVSSLRAPKASRPANLESAGEDAYQTHAQALFQRDLARVNHFDDDSGLPGVVVRRFFGEDSMRPSNSAAPQVDRAVIDQDVNEKSTTAKRPLSHQLRKRQPKRLNFAENWPEEPSARISLEDYPDPAENSYAAETRDVLVGLGPLGTQYTDTFDVTPLPTGTCFSTNTLLGSGVFAKALKYAATASLERSRGYTLLTFEGRSLRWGPWNDTVSSELGEVFQTVCQSLQNAVGQNEGALDFQTYEQILLFQKSILEYFSNNLSFLDPVDRIAYVFRCKGLLSTLIIELVNYDAVSKKIIRREAESLLEDIQISTLTLSLANQLLQICDNELIPSTSQYEVRSLVQKAAYHTLELSLGKGLAPFRTCLSKLQTQDIDYRIQDHSIEAFVVAQQVLSQDPDPKMSVWLPLLKAIPAKSANGVWDTVSAEQIWRQLFYLLPFLEIDAQGVLETGRRFKVLFDDWTLAKRLMSPVLEVSLSNPRGQAPNFNSYCRAVLARCLHLINGWGWRRCESIIGMLFDYFARNNLANLRNEESKGSPLFLERLDKSTTLTFEPEDRAFHILLKIIGSGLRHMRQSYPEKKIRDVVWRLMPNHGRSHPKEEAIRQEDLDALRNHHDLLCTLYWTSPSSCRPQLTAIRSLVNIETSHREACHINIRAWFNLVKFQLSTDELISNLEPFAEWHNHFLVQLLRQHTLARTEAEDQVRSAQSIGEFHVSQELLETTIARNQRQVEAILGDALVCLRLAIDAAQDPEAASTLLSLTLTGVFGLFDANRSQANRPIIQALDVLDACASKSTKSREANEESQDYGDWSAFEDESSVFQQKEDTVTPFDTFQDPLRHLLWNCFGADLVPEEALLSKVVDVWVVLAQVSIRTGVKSWADYLGRFGNDSWSSLRDTEQTRKFSVYYLATLVGRDHQIYHNNKAIFSVSWVCSLVERESLLKFQHRLTSALLNIDSENALLQNLPFWKDAGTGEYQISALEFSDRRLSLISSVLSNMRVSSDSAAFELSMTGNELRQELRELLKRLMATMKRNYQELGHGSNVKGAYVDFVHRVIEFLQQHTSNICPIDRFFTDNSTFPLPATDPTYVVGQLKNYALRLQDARTPKQLVVFLQSVSERAAVDGQQAYLVGQLRTAMSNSFEDGVSSAPTLRSFIVQNIVPAYIEMAFSTTCGWILALPFLEALRDVFEEILVDLDGTNTGSIAAVANTIAAFLDSIRQALEKLITCSDISRLRDPKILKSISACYEALSALLPALDYITRLLTPSPSAYAVVNSTFFISFATSFSTWLYAPPEAHFFLTDCSHTESPISDVHHFATKELKDSLSKAWRSHDDRYYVLRGASRKEVRADVGVFEEERGRLVDSLWEFRRVWGAMPALRGEDDIVRVRRDGGFLGDEWLGF